MPVQTSVRFRRGVWIRAVTAALVLGVALAWGAVRVGAAPPGQSDGGTGEALFNERCASCHTIGGGERVGPDLVGVVSQRDSSWLERWIVEPDRLIAEGDPLATRLLEEYNNVPMPNMGVTPAEARAIMAYIEAESARLGSAGPAEPAPAAPVESLPAGDPVLGRQLFTGQRRLINGGTACISCHTVSNVGRMGGGTLGPDLTDVAARYGDQGLRVALENLAFPSMQGIFRERPLTPEEVAHLQAYFIQANEATAAREPASYTFVWVALAGAALLLTLSNMIWRKRHRGVRKPLIARMQSK